MGGAPVLSAKRSLRPFWSATPDIKRLIVFSREGNIASSGGYGEFILAPNPSLDAGDAHHAH